MTGGVAGCGRWPALAVAVAVVLAVPAPGAAAVLPDQGQEPRVRALTYRWRALDGSERVEEGGEETVVTLAADVVFAFDRADLGPDARSVLERLAGRLDDLGPRTVTITGHTDSRGETAYNQRLSEDRAASVRDALAERLGGEFTLEVAGHGESRPVAPNERDDGSDDPEGRARNRRVEIRYPSG